MTPDALIKLIESGNTNVVEEEWGRITSSPEQQPQSLVLYRSVLAELVHTGRQSQAEELAWAAIESVAARVEPGDVLKMAGPFLLALGESETVRGQVVELFRQAHGDREGLDELIEESGLAGGRPVRRALRTLNVCLALGEGDFLAARDEDAAARIESIDCSDWRFTVTEPEGTETYGAVHLADRYRPAKATEFRVLKHFDAEGLARRLQKEPGSIVVDICREHGGELDSDRLEAALVPDVVDDKEWKKWWTRARTALKRHPNIKLEGRSPVTISYVDAPIALEDGVLGKFKRAHGPLAQLDIVEDYLKECKACSATPSQSLLQQCLAVIKERAERQGTQDPAMSGLHWTVIARIAEAAEMVDGRAELVNLLRTTSDLPRLFGGVYRPALIDLACGALIEARPDNWVLVLADLLPLFPMASCDRWAVKLAEARFAQAEFEPIVQRTIGSPVEHFEALLWLWDGPTVADSLPGYGLVSILMRMFRTLEECRLSEQIPRDTARRYSSRARAVLSARNFERFDACLVELDAGMAGAVRTQLRQQDSLGRAVREDLIRRLDRKFPPVNRRGHVPAWALEDVLYVTAEGLARKREEINHHVNVTIRENAIAIGRAAEHGDLSENSEYKFALEERDLLQARLAQMNSELSIARVMSPADVPTKHIGIGTRVAFERVSDGEPYTLTFVGPWEADGEKGWINYGAPLAQKLMGKGVGEIVDFDHSGASGQYKVVRLENGLDGTS